MATRQRGVRIRQLSWIRGADTFGGIAFSITLPLLLLSGVLLPMSLAPKWLQTIAALNPLSYAVDAARAAFNNHLAEASVVKGFLLISVLPLSR